MAIKRIVANVHSPEPAAAKAFYGDVLGMDVAMDMGWIVTFAGDAQAPVQLSIISEGGNGAPAPDISIEVDDLDALHARCVDAGVPIEYGPVTEPWGVRRFFVRDPFGRLLNIIAHA